MQFQKKLLYFAFFFFVIVMIGEIIFLTISLLYPSPNNSVPLPLHEATKGLVYDYNLFKKGDLKNYTVGEEFEGTVYKSIFKHIKTKKWYYSDSEYFLGITLPSGKKEDTYFNKNELQKILVLKNGRNASLSDIKTGDRVNFQIRYMPFSPPKVNLVSAKITIL